MADKYKNMTPEEIATQAEELTNREKRLRQQELEIEKQCAQIQNQWRDADSVALKNITEREKTIEALRLQLEKEKENREHFLASQVELQSDLESEKSRRKLLETAARERTEIEKNLLAERAQLEKQLETALEQGKSREIEKENRTRKMIDSGNGIDVKKSGATDKCDNIAGDTKSQMSHNSHKKGFFDEVDDLKSKIQELQNISINPSARTVPLSLIIKGALAMVPTFDGKNLFKFIKACKRLESQIPRHAQADAVTLLKTKVSDSAFVSIEHLEFDDIKDFVSRIRQVFAPHQTSNYFRGKLAALARQSNESILDFISRVSELKTAIIECTCAEKYQDTLSVTQLDDIEREIMSGFKLGLPPFFRIQLDKNALTLQQLFDDAIRVDKQEESDREKYRGTLTHNRVAEKRPEGEKRYDFYHRNDERRFDGRNTGRNYEQRLPQQGRVEHPNPGNKVNFPRNQNSENFHRNDREYRRPPYNPEATCSYCKRVGHEVSDCRTKRYFESRDQGNGQAARREEGNPRGTVENPRVAYLTSEETQIG